MDPSQRKLLEVAYEAIENAGETWDSISGSQTGVFVGTFDLDHYIIQSRDWDYPRPYAFTGAGVSILANRISYIFNLQGPSFTADTACSSSMYALHVAVNSIRAGECDSAIVASANWIADPHVCIALDKLGALSASSRCHTFDARADGYARGEGYGAIYLKRSSLAMADKSPIRAMIRGTAVNSNGRTGGITRPSVKGQEAVIRKAYRNAGSLPFHDTGYFECHGTGTYVGDPIEVEAVGRVFAADRSAEDPLLVGSVKSNIGHCEGASALASIMKVVLSLENGIIPPIYSLETRNPNIDFDRAMVQPVTELTPWPKHRLRRASINSFGYGGANGHCIIDHVKNVLPDYVAPGVYSTKVAGMENEHTDTDWHTDGHRIEHHLPVKSPKLTAATDAATRQFVLLPLSAHSEQSLKSNFNALSQVIDRLSLADVAYTLSDRRSRYAQRSFCIVEKDNKASTSKMDGKVVRAPLHKINVGFIFCGQGTQWHSMGAELFEYRVFRTTIEYLDYVLSTLPKPPSWSLRSILGGNCDEALIHTAEVAQPASAALQIGLVDLLASWSVRPSVVAGHSAGEVAAAYASGRITAAEAIVTGYLRGQAVSEHEQNGAMLAVGLGPNQVAKYLEGRENEIKLAAINSPESVTISGDEATIDDISAAMAAENIFNRKLKTGGYAYHSHHMIPIGRKYADILGKGLEQIQKLGLASAEQRYRHIPWVSSVTPSRNTAGFNDPASYWRLNLEYPVLFSEAVSRLLDEEDLTIHALVEIGPHPALKSPLQQISKAIGKAFTYVPTLKRKEDARISMLQLAGTLFGLNAPLDIVAVNAVDKISGRGLEHGCTCLELPPYQYNYGELIYHESRVSKEYRFRSVLRHDLIGSKVVGNAKLRPQWRNILRMKDVPWLGDHRLVPDAVLPAAGYLVMAIEAASRTYNEIPGALKIKGFSLSDVFIKKSLLIPEDDYGVEVLTAMELVDVATAQSPAWATFSISSVGRETQEWTEHSIGRVKVEIEVGDEDGKCVEVHQIAPHNSRGVDARAWYKRFSDIGLGYGPSFQSLSNIFVDPTSNQAVATISLHPTTIQEESRYALHPASLDSAMQLGLIAYHGGQPNEAVTAFVPVQLSRLYLANDIAGDTCTVIARGERNGIRSAYVDLQILGPNGKILLNADSLRCISYSSEAKHVDRTFSSPFTRLVWKPDIRTLTSHQARQVYPPPRENFEKSAHWVIMNKLSHFIVFSLYEKFRKLQDEPKPLGELRHFYAWIKRKSQTDRSDLMEEARKLASDDLLLQEIEDLVNQVPDVVEVKVAKLLHDNMADIFHGRRTGMDVVIGEDLLTPLYETGMLMSGIYPQLFHILASLAHSDPNLRILEIGGGTGGGTRIAMKAFNGPNGIKAYQDYTFTDISPSFLSSARESMIDMRDMKFSVLDIEVDPTKQGYHEQTYDLIIACQVLHATSKICQTLSNCRKLLSPGGRLVLVETNKNFTVLSAVVGTFTGYWAGVPDGRVDAPFQSLQAWDSSLREAGFSGLDVVLDDYPEPHNTTSVILSTALQEVASLSRPAIVHVFYSSRSAPQLIEHISEELGKRGIITKVGKFDDAIQLVPESHAIVFFDKNLLVEASEHHLKICQQITRNVASLIAITSSGIVKGCNADGALIPGLLRVLQNENPTSQYASVDINADNFEVGDDGKELARCIVEQELKFHGDVLTNHDEGRPKDREFSWQDGCMWVSRYVPDAGFHSQYGLDNRNIKAEMQPIGSRDAVKSTFETPGILNSLCFVLYEELQRPLQPGFIDVAVAAVGVNWRDLDHLTGRTDGNYISSEYAGVVTAVGTNVNGLKVGDRVYGLGKGQLGNYTRVPAIFASKLSSDDDMTQMVTIPWAYTIAIYAFDHIVHLKKGQAILIQSGAKDVGIASICLAKAKGADVFAVVETAEQANFLENKLAMSTSHVITAPSLKNLRRSAKMTRRGKFDVILNTARGDLLYSFLQVLAPLGHIIDVGQTDIHTDPVASMDLLRSNATYCSVDPITILDSDPVLGEELIQAVDSYRRRGLIGPIQGGTISDAAQLSSALRNFSNMIGKLVVSFEDPKSIVRMIPSAPTAKFDSEPCYVITGALGGVGQSLIPWMINRGARHLALLSRRHISSIPEAQKRVELLASRNIHVECFVCDVSKKDQVVRVIQQISLSRPIRGIVHAAVSYLDLSFDKLSHSKWNKCLSAKVEGTKNLHEATLSMPLDFFVMVTSALSVYAFETQGAYSAANDFQAAFARYRRQMGLPASTVSLSLIRDVTDVGTDASTIDLFERNRALTLDEHQFLVLLEPAFLNNRTVDSETSEQWFGQEEDPLSAANLHTYLDPFSMMAKKREEMASDAPSSAVVPRWYSDARVSRIMRAFFDCQQQSSQPDVSSNEESNNTVAYTDAQVNAAIQEGTGERASIIALVQGAIVNVLAEMMFVDVESIDPAKSMDDLGVDSLIAAGLRNWFVQTLNYNISMLDLLDPTLSIAERAAHITDKALSEKTEAG
ncbi:beta-ketoacyl synthase domain-containing protein [Rostrohypoxylon terebratum]|nr:beta-ketoacyl synthase domain-containing protein [Rostrohypoxylon terebratum]